MYTAGNYFSNGVNPYANGPESVAIDGLTGGVDINTTFDQTYDTPNMTSYGDQLYQSGNDLRALTSVGVSSVGGDMQNMLNAPSLMGAGYYSSPSPSFFAMPGITCDVGVFNGPSMLAQNPGLMQMLFGGGMFGSQAATPAGEEPIGDIVDKLPVNNEPISDSDAKALERALPDGAKIRCKDPKGTKEQCYYYTYNGKNYKAPFPESLQEKAEEKKEAKKAEKGALPEGNRELTAIPTQKGRSPEATEEAEAKTNVPDGYKYIKSVAINDDDEIVSTDSFEKGKTYKTGVVVQDKVTKKFYLIPCDANYLDSTLTKPKGGGGGGSPDSSPRPIRS